MLPIGVGSVSQTVANVHRIHIEKKNRLIGHISARRLSRHYRCISGTKVFPYSREKEGKGGM